MARRLWPRLAAPALVVLLVVTGARAHAPVSATIPAISLVGLHP